MSFSDLKYQDNKMGNWGILQKPSGAPFLLRHDSNSFTQGHPGREGRAGTRTQVSTPSPVPSPFHAPVVQFYFKNHQNIRAETGVFTFPRGL